MKMTMNEIELRLRLAAPDEPDTLPPLVFPALAETRPGVRLRPRAVQPQGIRLVYVLAALLMLAAVFVVGALRLLNDRTTPSNVFTWPPAQGVLGIQDGFTLEWPQDWHRAAEGGLFQGDFTQVGISYERVALVLASTALTGCPGPGGTGGPLVAPSGDPVMIPRETLDPAVACLRTVELPEGSIRLSVEVGQRTIGEVPAGGPATVDTSEPTPESGWTEVVGGQPARLQVLGGEDASGVGAAESRIWDVIFPGTIDHVLRIRADIAGPDLIAARAAVQSIIESIAFPVDRPVLDQSSADRVLETVLDDLDRSSRESRSDFFACFPRQPGTSSGTISAGPGELLVRPVNVDCTAAIEPSVSGSWRITLTTTWPAGDGYPAGGIVQELFVGDGDGFSSGGSIRPIDGTGVPPDGAWLWLPQAPRVLPPPGAGPSDLAAGTFVEILWPGLYPSDKPGTASSDTYPAGVGWHAYVLDGPSMIDGQAWYPVQWEEGRSASNRWLPATRDGRPAIKAITPACPTGELTVGDVTWITAAERVACFGDRELTFVAIFDDIDGATDVPTECWDSGAAAPTTCPTGIGSPSWLTVATPWTLFGPAGPTGPEVGIQAWLHPTAPVPTAGEQVRVRGHFDDVEAAGCVWAPIGSSGLEPQPPEVEELVCRERFVVTAVERL